MYQKQEEKRIRWNEVMSNKEKKLENDFKIRKEYMAKQTKMEKEKAL